MNQIHQTAIETYQCPGCGNGYNISCFEKYHTGIGCGKHCAGTIHSGMGSIFLGMPKGFNRLGPNDKTKILIYKSFEDYAGYNKWNIPTWKYLDENGHTLVRWMSPILNYTGIHVFLEDCRDNIDCYEITKEDIDYMD